MGSCPKVPSWNWGLHRERSKAGLGGAGNVARLRSADRLAVGWTESQRVRGEKRPGDSPPAPGVGGFLQTRVVRLLLWGLEGWAGTTGEGVESQARRREPGEVSPEAACWPERGDEDAVGCCAPQTAVLTGSAAAEAGGGQMQGRS